MTKLTFILIFFTLLGCNSSKKENLEVKKDSIQNNISVSPVDSDRLKLQNRRRELEKIGYNYSHKILSTEKLRYDNKELTFIQDLLDSSNQVKGKLYVELLNDSAFKRLYILNGKELKYFIGDNIFTNTIDTLKYGNPNIASLYFSLRYKYYFTVYFPGADPFTIKYIDSRKRFDNAYWDMP